MEAGLLLSRQPGGDISVEVLGATAPRAESAEVPRTLPGGASPDRPLAGRDDLSAPATGFPPLAFDKDSRADSRTAPSSGHYRARGVVEPIHLIESQQLPFHLANIVKYVCRWEQKGGLDDLEKQIWYLRRFITLERLRRETVEGNEAVQQYLVEELRQNMQERVSDRQLRVR